MELDTLTLVEMEASLDEPTTSRDDLKKMCQILIERCRNLVSAIEDMESYSDPFERDTY